MLKYLFRNAAVMAVIGIGGPLWSADHGNVENGAEVFKACKVCHRVGQGATNRIGPQLNGVFGRAAGAIEGFRYSAGLEREGAAGLIWTFETLDAYIENPRALVSRTRMNFRGIKDPVQRADLLAYLRTFSDNPADIPEAEPTAQSELPHEILSLVGDPEYGEYLSSECATCHRVDGSDDGIPSITGWPTEDFVVAMHAYKEKIRPHPVMQMMAGRLTNEEIAGLAAYFSGL